MKKKILIVEDLLGIAQNIRKYLEHSGIDVSGIISFGEDAVDFVEVSRPDLVLMDIDLAGDMDGIQAAEEINERFGIPIIFITATDSDVIIEKASGVDPFGYILKPFSEKELRVSIEMAFYKEKIAKERQLFTKRIERLHETALDMNKCETKEEIYDFVMKSVGDIVNFDCFSLYVHNGRQLVLEKSDQTEDTSCIDLRSQCMELAEKTWKNSKVELFNHSSESGKTDLFSVFGSIISAPVDQDGVLQLYSKDIEAFTQNDRRLLLLLINHMVESLNRVKLQAKLEMQAIHDPLTGVFNRFYFYKQLENLSQKQEESALKIAFLMIDVNDLKIVNDKFGHQTGDEVLKIVANILNAGCREEDIVIRYGGDEFLVLLLETGEDVKLMKERIMQRLKRWNDLENPYSFPITFAVGTAYSEGIENWTFTDLLSAVDKDMYQHKKTQKERKTNEHSLTE